MSRITAWDHRVYTVDTYGYKNLKYSYTYKNRVVKVQTPREGDFFTPQERAKIIEEYEFTNQAGHLGIKEPVFTDANNTCYIVMKRMPGKELFKVMQQAAFQRLSEIKKIQLCGRILEAIQTQVVAKGLFHMDIKPENILVQLHSKIKVNIIDYGLSIEDNNIPLNCSRGTPGFIAPELFSGGQASTACDTFSTGILIAEIFGIDSQAGFAPGNLMQMVNAANAAHNNLNSIDNMALRNILHRMLQPNPDDRCTINEAIAYFEEHLGYTRQPAERVNPKPSYRPNAFQRFFTPAKIVGLGAFATSAGVLGAGVVGGAVGVTVASSAPAVVASTAAFITGATAGAAIGTAGIALLIGLAGIGLIIKGACDQHQEDKLQNALAI